jgi:ABC-type transport system involved in multi-copper enzyme maturation permease subunit
MVMNAILAVVGPLAGPECRRALGRGWVIVVRSLVASAVGLVVLAMTWIWWLSARLDPWYSPSIELRTALAAGSMFVLTIAVVMAPAVLAGSLAGERERGILQHLLITAVSPREIVLGRLAGKLSQVGMVLLAALPALVILAALMGLDFTRIAALVLLLSGVLAGGGGMALGASVMARRGRDALLGAYLMIVLLLMAPMVERWVRTSGPIEWLEYPNPYLTLARLVWQGETGPALATSGIWMTLGLLGMSLASWRLLPNCFASEDRVKRAGSRRRVPPVGERPMLWKELFIERAGTLGRLGRWLGALIVVPLGGGSLIMAGIAAWALFWRGDYESTDWAIDGLAQMLRNTHLYLGWVIQWAVGLRAAVSIASEREKGTWDALLTSPLEPGEIVWAKVYGSIYALRWFLGTILMAWTLGACVEAIGWGEYADWMVSNLTAGILMAAIGVRCSLSLPTATKAMTWTIALWLGSSILVAAGALAIISVGMLFFMAWWLAAIQFGIIASPTTPPWFPLSFATSWLLSTNAVTLLIGLLIILDTRVRFDRIAGRMTAGTVETTFDALLHGEPGRPILFDPRTSRAVEQTRPAVDAAPSPDVAV